MKLYEIKKKFRHRATADIKDLNLILAAAPVLIREIDRLEAELQEAQRRIDHLTSQMRKKPKLHIEGKRGAGAWEARIDEKKNRFYIKLAGSFDYQTGKAASNGIIALLEHIRQEFDLINDISQLGPEFDRKGLFHLKKVMYHIKKMGVRRVVRVINPSLPQMAALFDKKADEAGYQVSNANSLADAEAFLNNVGRFLKT
jgi:hypothetical protein